MKSAVDEGINLRAVGDTRVGITLDERTRPTTIETVWRAFGIERQDKDYTPHYHMPEKLIRKTEFLTHRCVPYEPRGNRDDALHAPPCGPRSGARQGDDPAGFMHNEAEFGGGNDARQLARVLAVASVLPQRIRRLGYTEMIDDLSAKLCDVTGYDAISMQPNSGAQGEYAGSADHRRYHRANGDGHRNICLIPMSAHGTNPASAQMVGWKVVPVQSAENGDIDLEDFAPRPSSTAANLAGCMITYPSTHGVFEETVH